MLLPFLVGGWGMLTHKSVLFCKVEDGLSCNLVYTPNCFIIFHLYSEQMFACTWQVNLPSCVGERTIARSG